MNNVVNIGLKIEGRVKIFSSLLVLCTALIIFFPFSSDAIYLDDPAVIGKSDDIEDAKTRKTLGWQDPASLQKCQEEVVDRGYWNGLPLQYVKECGFTVKVVSYARTSVMEITKQWLDSPMQNDPFLTTYVGLFALLAMVIHGAKMTLGGLENPGAESFYLIIKIAAASYFTFNLDDYAHLPFAVLDLLCTLPTDIMEVILRTSGSGVMDENVWGPHGLNCFDIPPESEYLSLWRRMDCLMSRLFGIAFDGTTILGGIAVILIAFLFSGPLAISVFMMFVSILFFFIGSYIKAVYVYARAIINLMILSIIGVFIIPFILLPRSASGTISGSFNKWVKQIMDSVLIPFLMYVYLSFFIIICVLCYQDIFVQLKKVTGLESCTPFHIDVTSGVGGFIKSAATSAANVAALFWSELGAHGWLCIEADSAFFKDLAIAAAVFLIASYLMYAYYRFFIALAAALGGQFDATLMGNLGLGKHFAKLASGAKAALSGPTALARQAIKARK